MDRCNNWLSDVFVDLGYNSNNDDDDNGICYFAVLCVFSIPYCLFSICL
jgi:hypothetical protein